MIENWHWEGCLRCWDSGHSDEPATGTPGDRGFQAQRAASVNQGWGKWSHLSGVWALRQRKARPKSRRTCVWWYGLMGPNKAIGYYLQVKGRHGIVFNRKAVKLVFFKRWSRLLFKEWLLPARTSLATPFLPFKLCASFLLLEPE